MPNTLRESSLLHKVCDSMLEYLLWSMSSIAEIVPGCSAAPCILVSVNTPSRYNHVHILFSDRHYGPEMNLDYSDPELMDKIVALVRKAAYSTDL